MYGLARIHVRRRTGEHGELFRTNNELQEDQMCSSRAPLDAMKEK